MNRLSHGQVTLLLISLVILAFVATIVFATWGQGGNFSASPVARTEVEPFQSCITVASDAAETLVPTPMAGEHLFAAGQSPNRAILSSPPMEPPQPYSLRWRTGVGIGMGNPFLYRWPTPRPGWYLNWQAVPLTQGEDLQALGMEHLPMVRFINDTITPPPDRLRQLAAAHPGQVWLIGNEPDVRWQDDNSPEEYACFYYYTYQAIKESDPTAQIAIGGISQVTPLRLAYLDRILASYQAQFGHEMPVDIWNIHVFVLREELGNWGVGIPPGFDDTEGTLWEIDQHDDLSLVEGQIRQMRQWMLERGEREKPLYITEYGILMPTEYGFDPFRVIQFMVGSFDLFNGLRDEALGYPADDHRLVQRWVWFSTWADLYPTGNLFTAEGEPAPLIRAMRGYLDANSGE